MRFLCSLLAVLLLLPLNGCLTRWVVERGLGPLPDRFDDIAGIESAWAQGDVLIVAMEGALARSPSVKADYRPPHETNPFWLQVHLPSLVADLPNIVPRESIGRGDPPQELTHSLEPIPVFDLRGRSIGQREYLLEKLAKQHRAAVFLFSRSEEYFGPYNGYFLFSARVPEIERVLVYRVELEPEPADPNAAWLALTPFAAVLDVAIVFPLSLLMVLFASSSTTIVVAT